MIKRNLPAAEYHAGRELSNSGISDLLRSPYHYWAAHISEKRQPRTETAAMRHGTICHAAVLEPYTFADRFPLLPFPDRRSKAAKEWIEALRPDQTAITQAELDAAMAQRESILSLPDVAQALASGEAEVSAYWRWEGVECRCRPDWVYSCAGGDVLLDLKTCGDASPGAFARQVARMGYHRQAAWYTEGWSLAAERTVLAFLFVAVEADYPYAAAVYQLDELALEKGLAECRKALAMYDACLFDSRWPGFDLGIRTLELPAWALGDEL